MTEGPGEALVRTVEVSPRARSEAIRQALSGGVVHSTLTAGQRRALDGGANGRVVRMTLVEFLTARFDEDETKIDGDWAEGYDLHIISEAMRNRMLAEIDAKRRIVDLHSGPEYGRQTAHLCWDSMIEDDECETLQALATPYADHPDYQQKWKP